jgi:pilus assembly protein FimV
MFRKSAVAAAMLLVSVAPQAFALGLGEMNMRSALNQPMEAVIGLTSSAGTSIEDISVSMASLQDHARVGMTKAAILADFRFVLEKDASGNTIIRVSSDAPVREPYLEFLLELDWPSGRLLRQYTVLVDPPVTMPATPAAPAAPVSRAATPAPVTRAPARKPVQRPVAAPATVSVAPRPSADEYGPIRRSDTLWSIAERVRPDDGISIEQMMLALLRANPDAFVNNNINRLKAGVTLNIPGRDEIASMSAREARAESNRQYVQWQTEKGQPAMAAEAAPPTAETTQQAGTSPIADADSGARLQLMAPEDDAVSAAASPGDPSGVGSATGNQELQQQLALATEEVVAERAQSRELTSRVQELEEQVTTMKRMLELKDDELAGLQQSIATDDLQAAQEEQQADAPVAAAAEEPVAMAAATDDGASPEATLEDAAVDSDNETLVKGWADQAAGLLNRLMDNPLLAGLGVLVAMLLGGFLWASSRSRASQGIFDDELTMERQLVEDAVREADMTVPDVSVHETEMPVVESSPSFDDEPDSDPVTEADVYLAYGRIQQAEDILLVALQNKPDNADARLKLLEVYHSAGNAAAFDQAAETFKDMAGDDDDRWQGIVAMGLTLSPHNVLYGGNVPAPEEGAEFDMDLSGLEEVNPQLDVAAAAPREDSNTIEFTLDGAGSDDEDAGEGLLESDDEMTTKLDLARAYIDMDDKDSARSILGEVIEEGNAEQKEEAVNIISRLA